MVDGDGNVRCPVCGASDFSDKRTGKAKWGVGVTLGVAVIAAAPKRLKCRGCGENLKRGGKPKARPVIDTAPVRARQADAMEAEEPNRKWADMPDRPPRSAFRRDN